MGLGSIHHSFDSVFESSRVEVHQQPRFVASQFQVRQQLPLMYWREFAYSLQFHYDGVLNEEVDAVANVNFNVVIDDRHFDLGLNSESSLSELVRQTGEVRALE